MIQSKYSSQAEPLLAAFCSQIVKSTSQTPLNRIKILLQTQQVIKELEPASKYKGLVNCYVRTFKEQGFQTLYRSNVVGIGASVAMASTTFMFNDLYREALNPYFASAGKDMSFRANMLAGALAGSSSLILAYPLVLA